MEGDAGNRPVPGRGEMVNLRWNDVDLESKLIHIQSDATFRTKAGKRRSVPLNNDAMEILQRRNNLQECEYVFTHRRRQLDGDWISKRFSHYIKASGLNTKLHFHSLRHTFATWLVKAGVSIYEVQKLLRHSNVTVTQVYSHLASEELHSAVARLQL
jgi:integrase